MATPDPWHVISNDAVSFITVLSIELVGAGFLCSSCHLRPPTSVKTRTHSEDRGAGDSLPPQREGRKLLGDGAPSVNFHPYPSISTLTLTGTHRRESLARCRRLRESVLYAQYSQLACFQKPKNGCVGADKAVDCPVEIPAW